MKIVDVAIRETPILGFHVRTLGFIVGAFMDAGAAAAAHPQAPGVSENLGMLIGLIKKTGGGGIEVNFQAK